MFLSFLILIFKHFSVIPGFDPRTSGVLIQLYTCCLGDAIFQLSPEANTNNFMNFPSKMFFKAEFIHFSALYFTDNMNKEYNMYFKGHNSDNYVLKGIKTVFMCEIL